MKYLIILLLVGLSTVSSAQYDEILNEELSKEECQILNKNLKKEWYEYDFNNKKVAFFSSTGGTVLRSKNDFFYDENSKPREIGFFSIVIFTEKQKSSHGYDVAVIYESKNPNPNISNKLKRIKRKTMHNN